MSYTTIETTAVAAVELVPRHPTYGDVIDLQ